MSGIRLLATADVPSARDSLIELMVDAVENGASVNFVRPMTREKAAQWWDGAFAGHAEGGRLIFVAGVNAHIDGTVQLVLARQENQPHRADIAKMLVHTRARRLGLGAALLRAAEDHARTLGRTLLTLDTEKDSAGEHLYAALGWTKFGEVPGFALPADGGAAVAASFFFKAL